MEKIIGFIGCGNMAKAMISGIVESKLVDAKDIIASDPSKASINTAEEQFNIKTTLDNKLVAKLSDIMIIAVKPNVYEYVLNEIRDEIKSDAIIVSIGGGISLDFLKKNLNKGTKYIKTMPNTPAMVGEAMSAISPGENMEDKDINLVKDIFESFGRVEILEEKLIDGFTGLCGSSPAYIYMIIEAMADGAVLEGIPRKKAYTMAAQSVLGAAKMVLDTGLHPGELKDNVTSPGGTTIQGVGILEKNKIRSTMIETVRVVAEKSRESSK